MIGGFYLGNSIGIHISIDWRFMVMEVGNIRQIVSTKVEILIEYWQSADNVNISTDIIEHIILSDAS